MVKVQVQKNGQFLVTIPKVIAQGMNLKKGEEVTFSWCHGQHWFIRKI